MKVSAQILAELMASERQMHAEIERLEARLHTNRRLYGQLVCTIDELVSESIKSESSASPVSCGDGAPSVGGQSPAGGGFRLRACTPAGARVVRDLDRALARFSHVGDTL